MASPPPYSISSINNEIVILAVVTIARIILAEEKRLPKQKAKREKAICWLLLDILGAVRFSPDDAKNAGLLLVIREKESSLSPGRRGCRGCRGLSRVVEGCRGLSRAVEELSWDCRA